MTDPNASPLNPLPPVVWIMALPLIAMEVVVSFGASGFTGDPMALGWRQEAAQWFGFSPQYLRQMYALNEWPLDGLTRLVSYPLIHATTTHAVMVIVFLLALGKFVGEVFRWWAVLAVVLVSTVVAAVVYAMVPMVTSGLIGGYPPVYGLIGAYTFVLWASLGRVGANPARAFGLIGSILLVQLVFGVLFGGGTEWIADLAGFAAGFLVSFVVSPGGWARVVAKLRSR